MEPDMLEHYRWMARYNAWFNGQLFAAADRLEDSDRKRDRGAFFGSIHRTLNHLIVADQIWLKRLRQCGLDNGFDASTLTSAVLDLADGHGLDQVVFDNWADLRAKRLQLDDAISQWLAEMPQGFPGYPMRYSNTKGVLREHPAWQALSHFFNHQTHHRGQVTTLMMQAGVDVGVTDLMALVGPSNPA